MDSGWCVYMVRCADDTLYTGIASDIERRLQEHNTGLRGAKYTRARRPVSLVYTEAAANRSAATRREAELRRMTRQEKEALIQR